MIEKILVATDGSAASNRAVDLAADMAARYDASVVLIHVIRSMQVPPDLEKLARIEHIGTHRQDVLEFVAQKILDEALARARRTGLRKARTTIAQGDPATALLRYARRIKADLVVMGTRGLGKVEGMLLGSVSRKVVNTSDINCLVVR